MSKIHQWKDTPHGKRVDVKLYDTRTTKDVFWSDRCNSYVLVILQPGVSYGATTFTHPEYGQEVMLMSINGAGEVRWPVSDYGRDDEQRAAIRHFSLVQAELKS